MYICICNAVTDSDIHEAVTGGVRNLRQLQAETGCSTSCGNCLDAALEELAEAVAQRRPFLRVVSVPAPA